MWALGTALLFRRPDQMCILRAQVVAGDFPTSEALDHQTKHRGDWLSICAEMGDVC